ncbi:MAG: hypothetical protein ACLQVI_06585 [Polyangiaceae bacterium]
MGLYRELTKEEYRATMHGPMRRMGIEEPTPTPGLSIKECVLEALRIMGPTASVESAEIPHVYITSDAAFSHVLVSFGEKDVFLVVIVDHVAKAIHGYFRLNLRKEYGLE